MRNIIIILASIFVVSVKSESLILTSYKCLESCNNLTDYYRTETLTGFFIQDKCHCMEYFGEFLVSENINCDYVCKEKNYKNGTIIFSQRSNENGTSGICSCFRYLDETVKYLKQEHYKTKSSFNELEHTKCNGNNTIKCFINKLSNLLQDFGLNEYQDGYEVFKKASKLQCPDCICQPVFNNTNLCIHENNRPTVNEPCEYKCIMNDKCQICIDEYVLSINWICNNIDECDECVKCIRKCQQQKNVKIGENRHANTTSII